jgi:hypothetical protein
MNEIDQKLVGEIVGAFIEMGVPPVRGMYGDRNGACAVGVLCLEGGFDAETGTNAWTPFMKRGLVPAGLEVGFFSQGITLGFDGVDACTASSADCVARSHDESTKLKALFNRGYAIGQKVWEIMQNPPIEEVPQCSTLSTSKP